MTTSEPTGMARPIEGVSMTKERMPKAHATPRPASTVTAANAASAASHFLPSDTSDVHQAWKVQVSGCKMVPPCRSLPTDSGSPTVTVNGRRHPGRSPA